MCRPRHGGCHTYGLLAGVAAVRVEMQFGRFAHDMAGRRGAVQVAVLAAAPGLGDLDLHAVDALLGPAAQLLFELFVVVRVRPPLPYTAPRPRRGPRPSRCTSGRLSRRALRSHSAVSTAETASGAMPGLPALCRARLMRSVAAGTSQTSCPTTSSASSCSMTGAVAGEPSVKPRPVRPAAAASTSTRVVEAQVRVAPPPPAGPWGSGTPRRPGAPRQAGRGALGLGVPSGSPVPFGAVVRTGAGAVVPVAAAGQHFLDLGLEALLHHGTAVAVALEDRAGRGLDLVQ